MQYLQWIQLYSHPFHVDYDKYKGEDAFTPAGRIGTAALLHNLGKMGMPGYIFSKTTPLTEEEQYIIRQHPSASTQILAPLGIVYHELQIIRHHHERFDGSGYPDGLKGREIEIGARVVAIADVFDAITSDHLHKKRTNIRRSIKSHSRWFRDAL